MDDLREELMRTKRMNALSLKENSLLRAKLRIAESECKQHEQEISKILGDNNVDPPGNEHKLRTMSLKRKVIGYKRALKEKTEENMNLLSDQNTAKAAQIREKLAKMELECNRLRGHLAQSIPESEFLREKQQYLEIINRLTEENMALRQNLGEFEKHYEGTQVAIQNLQLEEILRKQLRESALSTENQAFNHKRALDALIRERRRSRNVSSPAVKSRKSTPASRDRPYNVPTCSTNSSSFKNYKSSPVALNAPSREHHGPREAEKNSAKTRPETFKSSSQIHNSLAGEESKNRELPSNPTNKKMEIPRPDSTSTSTSKSVRNKLMERNLDELSDQHQVASDEYLEMVSNSNESYLSTPAENNVLGAKNRLDSTGGELKECLIGEHRSPINEANTTEVGETIDDESLQMGRRESEYAGNLKDVLRSVQSHLLRRKMLHIRQQPTYD